MLNSEIYGLTKALGSAFNNETKYLPARINFFIQKNKNILAQISDSIEECRLKIIQHYGVDSGDGQIHFTSESQEKANQELKELLEISQEIEISILTLADLEGLDFTPSQMQALLFMIEED